MPTERMRRVNEVVREVVSSAIATELEDPRIGFVTVTAVETSPDLRTAKVYVSVLGDDDARTRTLAGLKASHGILQGALGRQLRMKRTPTLRFVYDDTIEKAARLNARLNELMDE